MCSATAALAVPPNNSSTFFLSMSESIGEPICDSQGTPKSMSDRLTYNQKAKPINMSLSDRILQALREKHGASQAGLARHVGIKQPSVNGWVSGTTKAIKGDNLLKAAAYLGVTPDWLATGKGPMRPEEKGNSTTPPRPITAFDNEDELPSGQYVYLPTVNLLLSAGPGYQAWEIDQGKPRAFDRAFVEREGINPACAATMVVSGDSMSPTLRDGWSVLVDYCNNPIRDGKVYAFVWQGEYFIKRLFKQAGGALLMVSDNPDKTRYPDRLIEAEHMEELSIIGTVDHIVGGRL